MVSFFPDCCVDFPQLREKSRAVRIMSRAISLFIVFLSSNLPFVILLPGQERSTKTHEVHEKSQPCFVYLRGSFFLRSFIQLDFGSRKGAKDNTEGAKKNETKFSAKRRGRSYPDALHLAALRIARRLRLHRLPAWLPAKVPALHGSRRHPSQPGSPKVR